MTKIGRNDPCPCGSGKKYKKCCLAKDEQAALAAYAAAAAPPATAPAADSGEAGEGGETAKARAPGAPTRSTSSRQERRFTPQVSAPPPIVRRKSV
ncbi:MAG TPA: SEC-C metal-binding domain-containing protein [Polyangiaceae bacterium]|nr:SEC-C metal-binding domain-containing protein [Polyangiaceae bacterium]